MQHFDFVTFLNSLKHAPVMIIKTRMKILKTLRICNAVNQRMYRITEAGWIIDTHVHKPDSKSRCQSVNERDEKNDCVSRR